jgi:hypothetical protein
MLTPIKCRWFNSRSTVGIVMAEDELGEIFYLIGAGDGLNEVIDINIITSFGAPFPRAIGDALFGRGAPAVAERPASAKRVPTVVKKGASAKKAITRSPRKSGK